MASIRCTSLRPLHLFSPPSRRYCRGLSQLLIARSFASSSSSSSASASASSSSSSSLPPVYVSQIPYRVPYALGLALQEAIYNLRGSPEVILLLEHTPVYTQGRRGSQEDVSTLAKQYPNITADYHLTRRGGLITYHGPGQLVGYPILHLGRMGLSNRCYVDRLQSSLSSLLLSRYKIPSVPAPDDNTGVWSTPSLKLISIGVQVRHRISSHGFALNVTTDVLIGFSRIVACGIQGKGMTCMQIELGRRVQAEEYQRRLKVTRNKKVLKALRLDPDNGVRELEDPATWEFGEIILGPEVDLLTVDNVAPRVAKALGKTLKRDLVEADEELLRYEADDQGILKRCWLQGKEITA